jgi:DNA-3-methyladenine glycosylase I
MPRRCTWSGTDPLYVEYHDQEWGVPVHDDRRLFEMLVLEGAQAGLSWLTILRKREGYRRAWADFDPAQVASYSAADVHRLLGDARIVRNRLKVEAAIRNARATLAVQDQLGSLDALMWGYVDGVPIQNRWHSLSELPPRTEVSDRMSRDLKSRGFGFVGSTICYAFMQAVGMVNDHLVGCFRRPQVARLARRPAGAGR